MAIKVLADAFALDAERLARFDREAKTIAFMNGRNIAVIHGLEKSRRYPPPRVMGGHVFRAASLWRTYLLLIAAGGRGPAGSQISGRSASCRRPDRPA